MKYSTRYPTQWDEIVTQFIVQHEPFEGYWAQSERYALGAVDRVIRGAPQGRLLDLGCGKGRLTGRFAGRFQEVVALDSDQTQIEQARTLVAKAGWRNVKFVSGLFQDCVSDLGTFDMVLCSHVIQHIPTGLLSCMFEGIQNVLVPGGVLALLTSHSRGKRDTFKVWSLADKGRRVIEEPFANADAFDSLFSNGCPAYQLPTHSFAIRTLRKFLAHYRLIDVRCFHALHKRNGLDTLMFRDQWINMPCVKGVFGIDVLTIVQRPLNVMR